MRILIIQTAFLGDVVLATSLLETLSKKNGTAEIDFLVRKGNQGLLEGHPLIHKLIVLDKSDKYRSLYTIIRSVRTQAYDLVINTNRYFSASIIAALSKSKDIRGYKNAIFSTFFTKTYAHDMYDRRHEIIRLHDLIEAKETKNPRLYTDHIAYPEGFTPVASYTTIAPSSVWETKRLPIEKWAQLCDKLDGTCYILGGPNDKDMADTIIQLSDNKHLINMCGKLSLLQSAKLISKAVMNYSNDSAPLHMASATNAPVTAFYLSTSSILGYTPLSENHKIIEVENLSCRPCGLHGKRACPEGHFKCAEIDVANIK